MQTSFRTTSKQLGKTRLIFIRTGREGPAYDPYSYTEYTVSQGLKSTITLHLGLAVWLSVNGKDQTAKRAGKHKDWESATITKFVKLTGLDFNMIERWLAKSRSRCKKCGSRKLQETDGYPGETLTVCRHCRTIVSCDFDEGAIL